MREEHRLRMSENRMLRIIFGENYIMRSLMICTPHPTLSSSVICQTTGPKPLPKRFLHIVRVRVIKSRGKR